MADPKDKVKQKPSEVLRQQNLEKIAQLEAEFGVEVDLSNATLGDIADLASNDSGFDKRMEIIQKLLSKGNARDLKILSLERFMELITLKLDVQSNPT